MINDPAIFIPARMSSTRFPGKPLAPIEGLPMVIYCAKNALKTGLSVFVCTDSKEIECVCDLYNIKCIHTKKCATGTDRVSQAIKEVDNDFIINLQGDEPLINSDQLKKFISSLKILEKKENTIINGITPIKSDLAFDPNNVKCAILEKDSKILYYSRKPLLNDVEHSSENSYYKVLGLYGMSRKTLLKFASLQEGKLEMAERVELLRWIENGYEIYGSILKTNSISVDTPQDLVDVIDIINAK
tara:strand:- start:191 stop:922 length:732 start_codon:yes stop_codon:yes gene_type:complete